MLNVTHINKDSTSRQIGKGYGNPIWYSCLDNPVDRGAWRVRVHGITKSWMQLSD